MRIEPANVCAGDGSLFWRYEAAAASCFVYILCADNDALVRVGCPLGPVGGISAYDANRKRFGYVLGNGKKLRHRLERLAPVVLVESGDNHALPRVSKLLAHIDNVWSEELPFIDPDDLCVGGLRQNFIGVVHDSGGERLFAVRDNMTGTVPIVDSRFEDHHFLPGDLCPPHSPYQFFRFSAEHTSGDDFDPSCIFWR